MFVPAKYFASFELTIHQHNTLILFICLQISMSNKFFVLKKREYKSVPFAHLATQMAYVTANVVTHLHLRNNY